MTWSRQETLLKIEDVCLSFGDNVVLDHVSAEIKNVVREERQQGQVVGFLGPSGRGKTQLFRILAGLNPPTSGRVLVNSPPHVENKGLVPVTVGAVGVVDQHYTLFPHRTVGDNLMVVVDKYNVSKDWAKTRAKDLLNRFHLADKWDAYPGALSGGQRQRVAICQQMMLAHRYLLMDEPFSGLDPLMKDEACKLISDIAAVDELLTIIVITHDIAASVKIADTLWLLGRGHEGPGSRIQHEIDLVERGLAWSENVTKHPEYGTTIAEVTEKFRTL